MNHAAPDFRPPIYFLRSVYTLTVDGYQQVEEEEIEYDEGSDWFMCGSGSASDSIAPKQMTISDKSLSPTHKPITLYPTRWKQLGNQLVNELRVYHYELNREVIHLAGRA